MLHRLWRVPVAVAILFVAAGFGSGERLFAPSADLWPRWEAHDPDNAQRIDHGAWAAFLERYLHVVPGGANRVTYGAVGEGDRAALAAYIETLAATPISTYPRDEQLAYWLNLYNALTIQVVLQHYPVETIRDIDISPGLFSEGPWGKELVSVEGTALTLNDIEHRILRPIWDDPRIHYAVNCASIGCPDLAAAPYRGAEIDAQLEAQAKSYVNDPRGVTIAGDRIVVSKIYDWFIEDFGGSERGVLEHLRRYAEPELARRLEAIGDLDDVAYDWSLNDLTGES